MRVMWVWEAIVKVDYRRVFKPVRTTETMG
jgi:hypothetical protein